VRAGRFLALQFEILCFLRIFLIVVVEKLTPHAFRTSSYVDFGSARTKRRILRSSRAVKDNGLPVRGLDLPLSRSESILRVSCIVDFGIESACEISESLVPAQLALTRILR
jgi:hypothetical protein